MARAGLSGFKRGQTGVLADAALQSFHRESGATLLRQGKLRLYVLRIDSEPVAALYGFLHQRTFYYYLGGFNPSWALLAGLLGIGAHKIRASSSAFAMVSGN